MTELKKVLRVWAVTRTNLGSKTSEKAGVLNPLFATQLGKKSERRAGYKLHKWEGTCCDAKGLRREIWLRQWTGRQRALCKILPPPPPDAHPCCQDHSLPVTMVYRYAWHISGKSSRGCTSTYICTSFVPALENLPPFDHPPPLNCWGDISDAMGGGMEGRKKEGRKGGKYYMW